MGVEEWRMEDVLDWGRGRRKAGYFIVIQGCESYWGKSLKVKSDQNLNVKESIGKKHTQKNRVGQLPNYVTITFIKKKKEHIC